jgi:hypothetical protein
MVDNLMEKSQYHQPSSRSLFHREITRGSLVRILALLLQHALAEDPHGNILKHLLVHYPHPKGYLNFSSAANEST